MSSITRPLSPHFLSFGMFIIDLNKVNEATASARSDLVAAGYTVDSDNSARALYIAHHEFSQISLPLIQSISTSAFRAPLIEKSLLASGAPQSIAQIKTTELTLSDESTTSLLLDKLSQKTIEICQKIALVYEEHYSELEITLRFTLKNLNASGSLPTTTPLMVSAISSIVLNALLED